MKIIGIIIAIILGFVVVGWGMGWFNKAAEVTSANHVERQWALAYTANSSLQAIAGNVCRARRVADGETDPAIRSQRQSQVIAQEQNYARVAAQYNAAMADAFQSKLIKPGDLATSAPPLEEAVQTAGC